MEIQRTGIEGVNILQPEVFEDERGSSLKATIKRS